MKSEKTVFEKGNKQVILQNGKFFTRIFEGSESFESGDFNTLERAKENLDIIPTTEENNVIIADFMGWIKVNTGKESEFYLRGENIILSKNFKFHSNWSDLMEVVEKLENMGVNITMGRMCCDISYKDVFNKDLYFDVKIVSGVKINATHEAIIRLLKWYNEQK